MNKNEVLTSILTTLVIFLLVSCAHREGEPDARTNPYDPGSESWKENASPIIGVSSDSLWYDYNHSKANGTIRISILEDDLNFPYDTLAGSVFYNGTEIKLPRFSTKKDTAILLSGIKPYTTVQCTVKVYDSKQSVSSRVLNITPPDSIPAVPPSAKVINSSQDVQLTWLKAQNTNYIIYYSDSLKGPYSGSIRVDQTSSITVSVYNQPSGYLPRYYIVATKNRFGTAFSTDTLIGRKYYSGISTPSLSVSQGSYSTYIRLSIYNSTYNLDYVEIYRSTTDTSSFRLIKTVKTTGSGYVYYNDTVQTSGNFYYKVHSIDKQGRCSYPSYVQYGFLQRLYAPTLSAYPYADYIRFNWSSVTGAYKFRLYRSPINCIDSLKLITETSLASCNDTPPDGKVYYYTVSAVAGNGLEGSRSSCVQSKITILPKPDSIIVTTNYYPRHVALVWRKVTGADGYIIHRSKSYSDSTPIDTITTNTYNDTLPDNSLRYYRIAAFNSRGTGVLSSAYSGSVITPTFSSYISKNDSLFLTFTLNSRAIKYFIYRSSNKTDFALLDSTTKPSYSAALKDFNTWYYRFSIQTPEGESYPSTTASIVRQLNTPYNIKITSLINGVRIEWSKVFGAEKYDIYRSTSSSSNTFYSTTTDTFFIDTLPEGSLFYYYSLRSVNSSATSSLSPKYKGSRMGPPETPTITSLVGQLKAIYLSWSMPTGSSTPDGFAIYRSTDNSNFNLIDSTKNHFYYDSVPDTITYYYQITAYNTQGYSSFHNPSYSATLLRPSAPKNLTGTLATSKKYICITWSPVSSITKYSIYRSTLLNGTYEYLGSVSNTNIFYDSTCSSNTTYYYKVTSISSENRSSLLSSYTIGIRLGPPAISTINKYNNGVMIWWNPLSYTIQYYNIYRAETVGGPYTKIDSTTSDNYLDSNGTLNSYYKVSAVNSNESDLSIAATVSTSISTISVFASQGTQTNMIDISWTPVSGATAYRIYRAPTDTFNRNITRIATLTSTTHTDYVLTDSIYYYKISVFTSTGESGFSTQTAFGYQRPTAKPLPITHGTIAPRSDHISLQWEKPLTSIGYNKYNIYRSSSAFGPFELLASTTETTYKDIPPQKTEYSYYVTAVNQMGESTPSGLFSGSLTQ